MILYWMFLLVLEGKLLGHKFIERIALGPNDFIVIPAYCGR